MEQNEYKEEGIHWETITFKDNKPILVESLSLFLTIMHWFFLHSRLEFRDESPEQEMPSV